MRQRGRAIFQISKAGYYITAGKSILLFYIVATHIHSSMRLDSPLAVVKDDVLRCLYAGPHPHACLLDEPCAGASHTRPACDLHDQLGRAQPPFRVAPTVVLDAQSVAWRCVQLPRL